MKNIRASIVAAGVPLCVLAAAAGCGNDKPGAASPPPASPAPATATATAPAATGEGGDFLTAVHNAGLPIDSDDYAIAVAEGVCDMIKEQLPDEAPQELVRNSEPDFTDDQVMFFINTAEQYHCPKMG